MQPTSIAQLRHAYEEAAQLQRNVDENEKLPPQIITDKLANDCTWAACRICTALLAADLAELLAINQPKQIERILAEALRRRIGFDQLWSGLLRFAERESA